MHKTEDATGTAGVAGSGGGGSASDGCGGGGDAVEVDCGAESVS